MALSSSVEVGRQIGQLQHTAEQMHELLGSYSHISSSKMFVTFPIFSGDESEDVREFVCNFKRAGKLNGWNDDELALDLPLYVKGHASMRFKTLENSDNMNFDDLSAALITHDQVCFKCQRRWRIRQALSQRRQLE